MMKIAVLLIVIVGTYGQVPILGKCPEVSTVSNFDLNRYLGLWYEQEKYFAIFEIAGDCISAIYGLEDEVVTVNNTQKNRFTGKYSSIQGTALPAGNITDGKLIVRFPSSPAPIDEDGNYWVLDTDYDNYSVVWSCSNYAVINLRFLWILTRARTPSQEVLQKAYDVLERNSIPRSLLLKTNQSKCD